jgi:hypothetical protein
MTLDAIDQAFIARWQSRQPAVPPPSTEHLVPALDAEGLLSPLPQGETGRRPCEGAGTSPTNAGHPHPCPFPEGGGDVATSPPKRLAVDDLGDPDLVARLLATSGPQWSALADELESARRAGQRTIGIAGGERAEGRTTLVACLARTLHERGVDVVVLAAHTSRTGPCGGPADGGRPHDKRIVLVDAGMWFPPGPIRRQRLLLASRGCDAAILVRRADREPAPAWAAALAAVGVTVLGEVVTFAATKLGDAA